MTSMHSTAAVEKQADRTRISLVSVSERPIGQICPSPENDTIYRPVDLSDPSIVALAESIAQHGVKEPLVITEDGWIISGHRRYEAAKLVGLTTVPVRIEPIRRSDDIDQFVTLLREYNRQREKSLDEKLREELISADPDEAYRALVEHRESQSIVTAAPLQIVGIKRRSQISDAKQPFLDAIIRAIENRRRFWPLSVRTVHYALLNNPPLKHAKKPDSVYDNSRRSYQAIVELLTRARLAGLVPLEAIGDETRPVTTWSVHREPGGFIKEEIDGFLKGYWRDLMQSQPNHVEIVGEKNTIDPILRQVAARYCIPLITSRGYCSLPPRIQLAERFASSGKEKLVVLLLSDFDPDGEEIAHSFARSMRDDFGIENIHPIKVAINAEHVEQYNLPPLMEAKATSSNHDKFVEQHGKNVWELEALEPEVLQQLLRESIDSVIDIETFNHELDAEKKDAAFLSAVCATAHSALREMDLGLEDSTE